jgi:hypothetical protein
MAVSTSSITTLSVPASASIHPSTTGSAATTTVPSSSAAPAGTAGTAGSSAATKAIAPTTTYVPSGANPLPGTNSTAAGTTATLSKTTLNARTLAHAPSKHSETLSPGAIALAAVAALLVLACLGWALARRRAFEPHWLLSLRHAMAEAGFRASATWAEFTDWARLGR